MVTIPMTNVETLHYPVLLPRLWYFGPLGLGPCRPPGPVYIERPGQIDMPRLLQAAVGCRAPKGHMNLRVLIMWYVVYAIQYMVCLWWYMVYGHLKMTLLVI